MNPVVYRLLLSCPDQTGIVTKVTHLISLFGGNILDAQQHMDSETQHFFMRVEIDLASLADRLSVFENQFAALADDFDMTWITHRSDHPKRMAILVSKESHCLADLLHRWRDEGLPCEVACIVGNHADLQHMAQWYGVPFYHVPVDKDEKQAAFDQLEAILDGHQVDLIVLARYMQILPPHFCDRYAHHVINIHHSFLPSFVGAKPYHQAYARGVKLIGATCHYVTSELDAGPIIEQDVIRIDHSHSIDDMRRLGRDVEKVTLAKGLRAHLEDRIVVHGNKTLVF